MGNGVDLGKPRPPNVGFGVGPLPSAKNKWHIHNALDAKVTALTCLPSAIQGRFLKVGKSVRAAPILDLHLGRLWEERRASAGGL